MADPFATLQFLGHIQMFLSILHDRNETSWMLASFSWIFIWIDLIWRHETFRLFKQHGLPPNDTVAEFYQTPPTTGFCISRIPRSSGCSPNYLFSKSLFWNASRAGFAKAFLPAARSKLAQTGLAFPLTLPFPFTVNYVEKINISYGHRS